MLDLTIPSELERTIMYFEPEHVQRLFWSSAVQPMRVERSSIFCCSDQSSIYCTALGVGVDVCVDMRLHVGVDICVD